MNLLKTETKIKNWIETHRITWCFILLGLGLLIAGGGNYYLSQDSMKALTWGSVYGVMLVGIEIFAGGSGVE